MPTDPFVAVVADDAPRHRQNLPAGVALPPARSWTGARPGDLDAGQPGGELLGSPGPNVGYAISLVARAQGSWKLAPHEYVGDAAAVVGEIAMKRASLFGRAPVKHDVDAAVTLLGYDTAVDAAWGERRAALVHDAEHHYEPRRAAVDLVGEELLRLSPAVLAGRTAGWRSVLSAAR